MRLNYMKNSETERSQSFLKSKIKYFFSETFRPRGKEDYAEVFRSGTVKKRVPWLYLRVLFAGFILFCVCVLAYRLDRGAVSYTAAILFGALAVNIPVLIFFYELNPFRDIRLLTLILTVIAGGVLAGAGITSGYELIYSGEGDSPWISLIWTGFWEELIKAVVAISAILILKKKSPLACFLIGFAVGTGYSVLEDMGYIFAYSRAQSTTVTWVVLMSLGRGLSCVVSHAPWTGMIAWAFAKFPKPFLNFRFYAAVLASMVLHYLADVPFFAEEVAFLTGLNWGWLIEAVVVAAILALVVFAWRNSFKDLPEHSADLYSGGELPKSRKLSHAGNVAAAACAVAVGAFTLAGCALPTGFSNVYKNFPDKESLVNYAQNGLDFNYDWGRAYDPAQGDYSLYALEGTKTCAVQKVSSGGYDYFYAYEFSDGAALLRSIGVRIGDAIYYCALLEIFDDRSAWDRREPSYVNLIPDPPLAQEEEESSVNDEAQPEPKDSAQFFPVNGVRAEYDFKTGQYKLLLGVRKIDNTAAYIAFGALAGAAAAGGAVAVTVLKLKARKSYDT